MLKKSIVMVLMACFLSVGIFACDKDAVREAGEKEQKNTMERARQAVPTPQVDNFLTRKMVAKWMKRMDRPNKTFYIYVVADSGAMIGYYVAQYQPVSTATFLTPTKERVHGSNGAVALPSPALDGTYYGEGGAASQYFWFDAETDAFISLQGLNYILSDQPLSVDAPRIKVEAN